MPRFFFHVRDGHTIIDEEGTEFVNIAAAKAAAVTFASEMLKWHAEAFWNEREWSLEVTSAMGLALFNLHFKAVEAPVMHRREGGSSLRSVASKPANSSKP